jgi:nitrite reductase/ring-hydroxylating ferredoxin subunit
MAPQSNWCDLGPLDRFAAAPLTAARIGTTRIVVTHRNGEFGALSGVCNHAGRPLAEGRLDGDYLVCPWHSDAGSGVVRRPREDAAVGGC